MKNDDAKSMSIRARINNFAKINGISPQLTLQAFFAERFLDRISQSRYVKNLAIKGGTLMSAILGVAQRTTMDIDASVVGMRVDEDTMKRIVTEVASMDVGDGVRFDVNLSSPSAITKDDDYGGFSIHMIANFGTIRLPIGLDLTFGDVITPKAEVRRFVSILGNTEMISVYTYTVETLIAEKLQTVLSRGAANTRPRDFYDLYMLNSRGTYDLPLLRQAMANTFKNRHSEGLLEAWRDILCEVAKSKAMRWQWDRYRSNASYAKDISFSVAVASVLDFFEKIECNL